MEKLTRYPTFQALELAAKSGTAASAKDLEKLAELEGFFKVLKSKLAFRSKQNALPGTEALD